MRRIGEQALTFRLPSVVDGEVTFIDPDKFLGQWVVLSFVPSLRNSDSTLWNRQGNDLSTLGAALLIVPLEPQAPDQLQSLHGRQVHFTIVGDPLGRLQRLYGGPTTQSPGRSRTFLIDPNGLLRFHLVHSLSERGMGVLTEVLQACQDAEIAALV